MLRCGILKGREREVLKGSEKSKRRILLVLEARRDHAALSGRGCRRSTSFQEYAAAESGDYD
jgi:hypothetical protein